MFNLFIRMDKADTYMKIGKGMKNVQLLVVDRTSLEQGKPRLCGIGEQGEIFVRAGGKFDVNHGTHTDTQL